jgi:hypothetical protein
MLKKREFDQYFCNRKCVCFPFLAVFAIDQVKLRKYINICKNIVPVGIMKALEKCNFLIECHFVSVLRERDPQPLPRQPRGRNRDAAIIIINKNSTALSLNMLKNETTVQELQLLPPAAVLSWLVTQRNLASIEDVTDELLRSIVEDNEFVAVFFR